MKNVEYPRRRRRMILVYGTLSIVVSIAGVSAGDWGTASVGPWFMVTVVVPVAYGPRWLGMLYAQPQLLVGPTALQYGDRYTVPFGIVRGVELRHPLLRRERAVFVAPDWKAGGLFLGIELRRGLPLSDYDRRWYENHDFVERVRAALPWLDIDSVIPQGKPDEAAH